MLRDLLPWVGQLTFIDEIELYFLVVYQYNFFFTKVLRELDILSLLDP